MSEYAKALAQLIELDLICRVCGQTNAPRQKPMVAYSENRRGWECSCCGASGTLKEN